MKKIRLRRIFNLISAQSIKGYLFMALLFFTVIICACVFGYSITHVECMVFLCFIIISKVYSVFQATDFLYFGDGRVEFEQREYTGVGKYKKSFKVKYILTDVTVVYLQSPVERAFGVGHVKLSGKIRHYVNTDKTIKKECFYIYGITDFENFKRIFQKEIERIDNEETPIAH